MRTPEKTRASQARHRLLFVSSRWETWEGIQLFCPTAGSAQMMCREGPGFTVTSSVASTQIRTGGWLFGGWLFFQTTWFPSWDPAMKNTALGYNAIALRKRQRRNSR